ncbi:RNA methyltransferase [Flavobacteriaceae bacterium]|nr:RNA methyltransferase [Flavobacteriaceae bacterium]MDB2366451.1 RNA methyltransferase [Flavobacteriaceae bacterium]MDC0559864.1 RNA methyltransferase [Flavobacteriaceae bacterium]
MLLNYQRKLITQLSIKKYRIQNRLFVAEGKKVVNELINSDWPFEILLSSEENFHPKAELLNLEEMERITHFKNPSPVLGVFVLPESQKIIAETTTIAVDNISDPGNLGTIIRLCDWFGLSELICSKTTVDCYNPKVIQASMGSIARVRCHYLKDLGASLTALKKPVYGATTQGDSIYKAKLPKEASYVFGSESHGISESLLSHLTGQLSIPQFREGGNSAESLNVANASAIFLSELFRSS